MLPVFKASVHDVRYFSALLRGVSFADRATVTLSKRGFVTGTEEARTLLGTAFIFAVVFDEFEYHPEGEQDEDEDEDDIGIQVAFEIPLNILLECLNIFGTAGGSSYSNTFGKPRWKTMGDADDGVQNDDERDDRKGLQLFGGGGTEKRTSMRLSYAGPGYPLTLILAEDADGPTTTCEIATYDAEPQLELPFDEARMVLKLILKSSWLRDALSELDPSCEKLTFICNPPPSDEAGNARQKQKGKGPSKPMFRIHASGSFGSTEMDYPNDRDVLESFDCTEPVSFSYRFSHIGRALKALQNSTKTSLRINEAGLLSLQLLMPAPSKLSVKKKDENDSEAFVEFRCLALDDDD